MKLNLFNTQDNDFKVLLKELGTTIKVNNIDVRAVVTNTSLNELDDKYISTAIELKRGDHIVYNGKDYYVINQVKTKRYESYKAIIRCAEHNVLFNLSVKDRQNSTYKSFDVKEVPCIVQTTTDFGLEYGRYMSLPDGELALFVQDNPTTRAIYKSFSNVELHHDISIDGRQFEYIGFDFINKGLVRINVKMVSTGNVDEQGIVWEYNLNHSAYDGTIDDSFYNLETVKPPTTPPTIPPTIPPTTPPVVDPNRTYTDVGTITYTTILASASDVADGSITFNWTADPLATLGYRVRLKVENYAGIKKEVDVTGTTATFTDLEAVKGVNDYIVQIETHTDTKYLLRQELGNVYLGTESGW